MSYDHSWCMDATERNCNHYECERHPLNSKMTYMLNSYMYFYGEDFCKLKEESEVRRMSAENGKVCCNCLHCIRARNLHDRVLCICEVYDKILSYSQVMGECCKQWSKEKESEVDE